MLLDEKIERLQKFTKQKITYDDIAKSLGITKSAVGNRIARKQPLKDWEILKLDETFFYKMSDDDINTDAKHRTVGDRIEIGYWDGLPDELKKPKITSVWFDREIVENDWEMSADNLCIVPMIGDKMTRYWYPIMSGNMLIVDTSQSYIMGNGVYFATSRNNTRFWIREMQALINDDILIKGFAPSGDTQKTFTQEQLREVDFRIIGKVIKNVSFRL